MPKTSHYWDLIESTEPEFWPGATPWRDSWGSFGSLPDAAGYGASVQRTRVPADDIEHFWAKITKLYPCQLPRFTVGPRETPGLDRWLASHGYQRELLETVMVLDRNAFHKVHARTHIVRQAAKVGDLRQVYALDHLVFGDPIPAPDSMARELRRLGSRRRIFFIPGYEGIAKAAGGMTHFPHWSLLWGGETHPAFRRQGLYQAVLAARIEATKQTSSTFVAVYANNDTSMPILQKDGFEPIASIEVWKPF